LVNRGSHFRSSFVICDFERKSRTKFLTKIEKKGGDSTQVLKIKFQSNYHFKKSIKSI
jgi:hypothetical protein